MGNNFCDYVVVSKKGPLIMVPTCHYTVLYAHECHEDDICPYCGKPIRVTFELRTHAIFAEMQKIYNAIYDYHCEHSWDAHPVLHISASMYSVILQVYYHALGFYPDKDMIFEVKMVVDASIATWELQNA